MAKPAKAKKEKEEEKASVIKEEEKKEEDQEKEEEGAPVPPEGQRVRIKVEEEKEPAPEKKEEEEKSESEGSEDKEEEKMEGEKVEEEAEEKEEEEVEELEDLDEDEEELDLDDEESEKPDSPIKKIFNKKTLIVFLVFLGIGALVTGGILVYRQAMDKQKEAVTPLAEQAPVLPPAEEEAQQPEEEVPEASPSPTLDRSAISLQVLNGSGEVGAAGKAKEFLEGLGYEGVDTGNADNYDYEQTEIALKEGFEDYFDLLKTDLREEYQVASETTVLDENHDYDGVITIGQG